MAMRACTVLTVLLALAAGAPASAQQSAPANVPPSAAAPAPPAGEDAARSRIFDEVWNLVNEHFYDPKFNGREWTAIGARYRPLYAAAATAQQRQSVIGDMLGELGTSHTAYLTPNEPAYYDLADIFAGPLRHDLPRAFPNGEVAYSGIGILTRPVDGKIFASGILGGSPAERSGLRTGDEIVAADGAAFDPIASFAGKEGHSVALTIRRDRDGPTRDIAVTPERIRPNESYLKAIRASARVIDEGTRKIGYVHIWSYGRREDEHAFEEAISTPPLKDADALVWDLRDGWGGTADPDYLDVFNPRGPIMTVTNRGGETHAANVKWRKPVVLLVNGGTRSAKEILAYGFKKYGFGPVVGERTKGDVLAARAFLLSDGSLLELPVDDVHVDGERLEGVGVSPTVEVPFALPYSAGADPQLARAVALAARAPNG